jgi:hypothetical protein
MTPKDYLLKDLLDRNIITLDQVALLLSNDKTIAIAGNTVGSITTYTLLPNGAMVNPYTTYWYGNTVEVR